MVDGDMDAGVERAVRRISWRRSRPAAGVRAAVCRLCGVAKEVDRRRSSAATGAILEEDTGGRSGVAGVANRLRASGAAGLPWCRGGVGVGRGTDGGIETVKPGARDNAVYDVAGGMGSTAGAAVGAGGSGDRNAGGQPQPGGD